MTADGYVERDANPLFREPPTVHCYPKKDVFPHFTAGLDCWCDPIYEVQPTGNVLVRHRRKVS